MYLLVEFAKAKMLKYKFKIIILGGKGDMISFVIRLGIIKLSSFGRISSINDTFD
jgi:hypothetical protein